MDKLLKHMRRINAVHKWIILLNILLIIFLFYLLPLPTYYTLRKMES